MSLLAAGARLGDYSVLAGIGRGGSATLYLAADRRHDRVAVLKLVASADADSTARLAREVELLRRIDHPNVVRVLGPLSLDGPAPWFPLEFVQGADLANLLAREGPLPLDRARALARDLGEGLAAIHAAGVLHRDLKPGNVMIDPGGRPRIVDLGLSVAPELERITATGAFLGTPPYMPPEQLAGRRDLDARADLYAYGVVVYETLTGALPHDACTIDELHALAAEGRWRPPESLRPGLAPAWTPWFARTLAPAPADRFPTATEAVAALP